MKNKGPASKIFIVIKEHPFLSAIVLLQFSIITYLNLFQLQHFLGFDCSPYYLQVMEIYKQKTLLISNWDYMNMLNWDSPVLLAVPFYALFKDIFLAYGIAVILSNILLVMAIIRLQRYFCMSLRSKLVFFIFFFTPFIRQADTANDIEYFRVMFFAHGAYSIMVFTLLVIWIAFLELDQYSIAYRSLFLSGIAILLCILAGMSSDVYVIVFGIAPIMGFYIFRTLYKNNWLKGKKATLIFLLLSIAAALLGKYITNRYWGFTSERNSTTWITLEKFWENVQSIFLGYLKLTGALPVNNKIEVFSFDGIGFAFRLCLSIVILIGGLLLARRYIRESIYTTEAVLTGLLVISILVFVPIQATYGAAVFESRYLIPAFIIILLFFSKWLDEQLSSSNRSWAYVLNCGLVICTLATNSYSYFYLYKSQNQFNIMMKIIDEVEKIPTPIVYLTGGDLTIIARNLRVLDDSKYYKITTDTIHPYHWGDYTYYDENADYSGPTAMVASESVFAQLPSYIQNAYTIESSIPETSINVYKSLNNVMDFATGIVNHNKNRDFPYSSGIHLSQGGTINEEGNYITDGAVGYVTWGPYTPVPSGKYKFTLNYRVLENPKNQERAGTFDIAINAISFVGVEIDPQKTTAEIPEVLFDETMVDKRLEYRVAESEGVIMQIESFEIERLD